MFIGQVCSNYWHLLSIFYIGYAISYKVACQIQVTISLNAVEHIGKNENREPDDE